VPILSSHRQSRQSVRRRMPTHLAEFFPGGSPVFQGSVRMRGNGTFVQLGDHRGQLTNEQSCGEQRRILGRNRAVRAEVPGTLEVGREFGDAARSRITPV
jgi:hypothetical protein